MDFLTMTWGKYTLPATHAFGGLAGGVEMQVRAPVSVSDLAVFNKPDPRSVHIQAEISSTGQAYDGPVNFSIARDGNNFFEESKNVHVPPGGTITTSIDATSPTPGSGTLTSRIFTRPPQLCRPRAFRSQHDLWLPLAGRQRTRNRREALSEWSPDRAALLNFVGLLGAERHFPRRGRGGTRNRGDESPRPRLASKPSSHAKGAWCSMPLTASDFCATAKPVVACYVPGAQSEPPHTSVQVTYDGKPVELDFLNRYQLDKELAMIRAFRSAPLRQPLDAPERDRPRCEQSANALRARADARS